MQIKQLHVTCRGRDSWDKRPRTVACAPGRETLQATAREKVTPGLALPPPAQLRMPVRAGPTSLRWI